jgi:hypothetical protein
MTNTNTIRKQVNSFTAGRVGNVGINTADGSVWNIQTTKHANVTLYHGYRWTANDEGGIDRVDCISPVIAAGKKSLVRIGDVLPEFADTFADLDSGFAYVNCGSVLSRDVTNEKLAKTASKYKGIISAIHYGAAGNSARVRGMSFGRLGQIETCQFRTKDCSKLCLQSSGNMRYPSSTLARIARTRLQRFDSVRFWAQWDLEFSKLERMAERLGKTLAIRPNGTTDEMSPELTQRIDSTPDVIWYDYTAVPSRVAFAADRNNYFVTMSRKETKANHSWIADEANAEMNIAVVVTKEVKSELLATRRDCVDGDLHDLRIPSADGVGVMVLLTPKGEARGKETGFIVSDLAQLDSIGR